jgi:hypothetical protein
MNTNQKNKQMVKPIASMESESNYNKRKQIKNKKKTKNMNGTLQKVSEKTSRSSTSSSSY